MYLRKIGDKVKKPAVDVPGSINDIIKDPQNVVLKFNPFHVFEQIEDSPKGVYYNGLISEIVAIFADLF